LSSKPHKFRFLLDENFPAPAGKFLKSQGHNVESAAERKNLRGKRDSTQIKESIKQNRIFVSLDRDFEVNENLEGFIRKSPGVILVESALPDSSKLDLIMKKILKELTDHKIRGKICRASIDKVRFE